MSKTALAWILAAAFAASLGVWYVVRDGASEVERVDHASPGARAAEPSPRGSKTLELDPADADADVAPVPTSASSSTLVEGVPNASTPPARPGAAATVPAGPTGIPLFEARYARRDSAEMMNNVRDLHRRIADEAALLADPYLRAGRYRVEPLGERDVDGYAPVGGVLHWSHVETELGQRHVVALPREDHPDLYAVWDEKQWLVRRIRELEFVDED